MLRSVTFENFIVFPEIIHLNLDQGSEKEEKASAYFLIGPNGSGKSSVFEAVRRCVSINENSSMSRKKDPTKRSFVICRFDIPDRIKCKFDNASTIYTGILQPPDKKDSCFKFTAKMKGSGCSVLIDEWKPQGPEEGNEEVLIKINIKEPERTEIENIFLEEHKRQIKPTGSKDKAEVIDEIEKAVAKGQGERTDKTPCHTLLEELDKYVAFTFPIRSIGPLQWSKSRKIKQRPTNYPESQARAEIINWFLQKAKSEKSLLYNDVLEEEIFSSLTGYSNYNFEVRESELYVTRNGAAAHLLKTPAGIIEAKQFSLLFSSRFLTIFLEEPTHGMSPEMIQRMRDLYLLNEKKLDEAKKTILVTTHHPWLIAPPIVKRLLVFRETSEGSTKIVAGVALTTDKKSGKEGTMSRFVSGEQMTKLLFAKKVLFCEGESDYLFLSKLKSKLLQRNDKAMAVLQIIKEFKPDPGDPDQGDKGFERRLNALAALEFIILQGHGDKKKAHEMCKTLQIEHFFLVDKDVFSVERVGSYIKEKRWLGEQVVNSDGDCNDPSEWDKFRLELQNKHGVFVWRDGAIEDMVIALLNRQSAESSREKDGKVTCKRKWNLDREPWKRLEKFHVVLKNKKVKLFMGEDVLQEDISNAMDLFLEYCYDEADDLVQFLRFLFKCANGEIPDRD